MTRAELYDLVWQTPTVHLARRFGITNAALRKLCNDYGVPLPAAGHWTKVAHGKQEVRTPLPDVAPRIIERFNQALSKLGRVALDVTDAQIANYDLDFSADIQARAAVRALPEYEEMIATIAAASRAANGLLSVDWPDFVRIDIATHSVARVESLLSGLFRAMLGAGFLISKESGLVLDAERFAIRIYETVDQTGDAKGRPTGRLCFEIFDPRPLLWAARNLVGHWHDARGSRVEDKIKVAVADTINAAPLIRDAREWREAEERRAHEAETQRQQDAFILDLAKQHFEQSALRSFAESLVSRGLDGGNGPINVLTRRLLENLKAAHGKISVESVARLVADSHLFDNEL